MKTKKIGRLTARELRALPFPTLSAIALALAKGIDQGEDNRAMLEFVFKAIKGAAPVSLVACRAG